LFLFIAGGLSSFLQKEVAANNIEPLKISRCAPGISHLLFADDSLLFFKAQLYQDIKIKEVLEVMHPGQLINPNKCSVMFGESCPLDRRLEVKSCLDITQKTFETKYLGLPTLGEDV
jgi:hypothetical protein